MLKNADAAAAKIRALAGQWTRAAEASVGEAAQAVRAEAAARAPVDTGRLRAGIQVRQNGLRASVTASCEYAAAVELGTSKMPARPYLLPAAQRAKGEWPKRAAAHIQSALKA